MLQKAPVIASLVIEHDGTGYVWGHVRARIGQYVAVSTPCSTFVRGCTRDDSGGVIPQAAVPLILGMCDMASAVHAPAPSDEPQPSPSDDYKLFPGVWRGRSMATYSWPVSATNLNCRRLGRSFFSTVTAAPNPVPWRLRHGRKERPQ